VRVLSSAGGADGRTVRAPLQGLAATFAPGTLAADGTKVGASLYQPAGSLPALGLQLTVDGSVNPGKLSVSYDLAAMLQGWDGKPPAPWLADPSAWPADAQQRALFAAQVTSAYAALTDAQRAQLESTYGITLVGGVLTFGVTLGDNAQTDGLARVEVDGLQQLGVTMEVTVLSAVGTSLPPVGGTSPADGLTPGREVPPVVIDAPPPITLPIISEHGQGLLADAGAAVIANNGGNLIGKVKAPAGLLADAGAAFGPGGAKRRLLAYTEAGWGGVELVLERSDGNVYGATTSADLTGSYTFTGVPDTAPIAFVHANPAGPSLYAMAKMPGAYTPTQSPVTADVNAATTAVTSYVKDEIAHGKTLDQVSMPGYAADVAALTAGMTQAQAVTVSQAGITAAAFVRAYFAGIGSYPQVLPPPPPPTFTGVNTVPGAGGKFSMPFGLVRDAAGNFYVAEQGTSQIKKLSASGTVTTLAGAGGTGFADGAGANAFFNQPQGLAIDGDGNLYVADRFNQRIRKVTSAGVVTTLAGTGAPGATDGPAASASFWNPFGVAVDAARNVYVADRSNNLVRKISAAGVVTTLASGFQYPESVAVDGAGNVIVADRANHRIKQIAPGGAVTTLAGTGTPGFLDGPAATAQLDSPYNVMVDGTGNIFFTCRNPSTGVNTIRVLTPAHVVATVAGVPAPAPAATVDGPIATARLNAPWGLVSDAANGRLYFTDLGSGSIRVVIP
jgi:hypothetical protein